MNLSKNKGHSEQIKYYSSNGVQVFNLKLQLHIGIFQRVEKYFDGIPIFNGINL